MKLSIIKKTMAMLAVVTGFATTVNAAWMYTRVDSIPVKRHLTDFHYDEESGFLSFTDNFLPGSSPERTYSFNFFERTDKTSFYYTVVGGEKYYGYGETAADYGEDSQENVKPAMIGYCLDSGNEGFYARTRTDCDNKRSSSFTARASFTEERRVFIKPYLDSLIQYGFSKIRIAPRNLEATVDGTRYPYGGVEDKNGSMGLINYYDMDLMSGSLSWYVSSHKRDDDASNYSSTNSPKNLNYFVGRDELVFTYEYATNGDENTVDVECIKDDLKTWKQVSTVQRTSLGVTSNDLPLSSEDIESCVNDGKYAMFRMKMYNPKKVGSFLTDVIRMNIYEERTITFKDPAGNVISTSTVAVGNTPEMPSITVKEDSEEFHYFVKCTPEMVPVTEDAEYVLEQDSVLRDRNAHITVKYEIGGVVSWETNSKCIMVKPNILTAGSIMYFYDNNGIPRRLDGGEDFTSLTEGDYQLLLNVKIGLNQCDDIFAKTIRYYGINKPVAVDIENATVEGDAPSVYPTENPDGVYWTTYLMNFTVAPSYTITFLDDKGNMLSSSEVMAGKMPIAPEVKTDSKNCHYIVNWNPAITTVTEAATYKAELDSVLKDPAAYITVKYEYNGGISWETNSECVMVEPNYIVLDSKRYFFNEDGSIDLTLGDGDYKFAFDVKVGLNQCDDFFAKSLRYYDKTTTDFYVNGIRSESFAYVSENPDDVYWMSYKFDFSIAPYSVTFFDDKGVQVGDVVTVASGMAVSAPAEPAKREGYTFAGWFQKDAESAYDFSAAVNEDLELYGKWTVNKYEIAVAANDSKMGSVKGAGTYEYGTEVELVATAAEGYKFSNWEDDAKASASRKVVVKADAEYTANFSVIPSSSSVIPSVVEGSSSSEAATNSSSSAKPGSSSSEKQSSSSVKPASSSSEIATNSSSSRNDTENSSSSSAKPNSSSSVKSSSSGKTETIVAAAAVPQFSLSVAGRNVQIAGACIGSAYAILDMQGRVLATGRTASASMEIALPRAGSYMVRVGSQTKRVNVK